MPPVPEVNEMMYWKDQMKQDIDSMMSQIKTKLYTGFDEMFGEMQNLFQEEEDEVAQAAQDVTTHDVTRMEEAALPMKSKIFQAKPDVPQDEENITVL